MRYIFQVIVIEGKREYVYKKLTVMVGHEFWRWNEIIKKKRKKGRDNGNEEVNGLEVFMMMSCFQEISKNEN